MQADPSSRVACLDMYGQIYQAAPDEISLRPAAYAILQHQDRILLLKMKATGKYHLPGGGIEPGETIPAALARELREEAGIAIEVLRLVHFEEVFFYANRNRKAYHGLHFFYACRPLTTTVCPEQEEQDSSAEKPAWVAIQDLRGSDFQLHGETILALLRS